MIKFLYVEWKEIIKSMDKSKKEIEKFYLELLKEILPDFPEGSIDIDREKPDFLVYNQNGNIGIELTRAYKTQTNDHQPLKIQESEQDSLVFEAAQFYERMGFDPVYVNVSFLYETKFTKKNRKEYALAIANLVANNMPAHNSWIELVNQYNSPQTFPFEIDSINIVHYDSIKKNSWLVPKGGIAQEDCWNIIQQIIKKKDKLLPTYKNQCKECWLLIVADWSGQSSFLQPDRNTITHSYKTTFDRVFFLNAVERNGFELQIGKL